MIEAALPYQAANLQTFHPMPPLRSPVPGESWAIFAKTVAGVWLAVWFYAAVHNQYLIRIAPEHFTVWHYRMPFFTSHTMLGVAYAFAASISPGLVLGFCLYVAGRLSGRPKRSPRQMILSTFRVWLAVEICAGCAGLIVWRTGKGFYPEWVYPDDSLSLLITQSIQITAYLTGAVFSCILVAFTWTRRKSIAIPSEPRVAVDDSPLE